MVELYVRLVHEGIRTIESVPERYRAQVIEKLTQL